ncbi:hypothetical protein AB6A40_008032 [Gnathostoma spinigerum]|uniref:SHSP domain-containing protein n=1 Tax=Gnathostoma spinigerum TaxID=75299 RepID=A0ABD6EMZ5_9BILA
MFAVIEECPIDDHRHHHRRNQSHRTPREGTLFDELVDPFGFFTARQCPARCAWRNKSAKQSSDKVIDEKGDFSVKMDVSGFKSGDLSVDFRANELTVQGHHEERSEDGGKVERHFVRKYIVPEDLNRDALSCSLSSEGVLSISAPKLTKKSSEARKIPIKFEKTSEKKTAK